MRVPVKCVAIMNNFSECDVLVVGGGPAGSTIASLLAQQQRHVVVLEKERFPRFHIGESLLPLNLPLFERLGVADEVRRIGVYKPGAELISDAHEAAGTFRFSDNPYLSVGYSYQVRRAEFDKLLLDNSRRLGAEVREEVRVTNVVLNKGQRPRITAVDEKGSKTEWFPSFLVDATGRDTLLSGQLGLKRIDKQNNTAAVFGHFRNVPRRPGDKAGMITVYLFDHGWFWMIPPAGRGHERRRCRNPGLFQGERRQYRRAVRRSRRGDPEPCRAHGQGRAARPAHRLRRLLI